MRDKPWQRRIKKVKIKGDPVSETIVRARYEEAKKDVKKRLLQKVVS